MYLQFNKSKGKNGKIYQSVLLCKKFRDKETGKPQTEVILNLSKYGLDNKIITALKTSINTTKGVLIDSEDIKINKTIDFGFVHLILTIMDKLRITETLEKAYGLKANIIKLMIIGKIMTQGSKLHIYNWIKRNDYLAKQLDVDVNILKLDDLYFELGEFNRAQEKVEKKWNVYHRKRHKDIYLYDITSSYFEGTENALSAIGYNRDGKKGKKQITIGLITDSKGFPLKIQVFEGNEIDYKTVNGQLMTIKEQFGAESIVLIGDRGMRIRLNLEELSENEKQNISYISALSSCEIRALINDKVIQLELFSKDLVEIEDEGIRYILCNNPVLQKEKNQTREALKSKIEQEISSTKKSWDKRREQNLENIKKIENGHKNKKLVTLFTERKLDNYKYRATTALKKYKMSKFYTVKISNDEFKIEYNLQKYQEEKTLDGKYVIESTVVKEDMNTKQVREKYKELQNVEHAFRDMKTDKLNIRPIFHINEEQTRGHVFTCMFSYAVVKELETVIYPWLKTYNKKNNCKLSYHDITDELNNIKVSELEIGHNIKKIMIPKLNEIQSEMIKLFNLRIEDIMRV
ncbi:MAG: IS1634 family transposase [Salinivirgaceae bacterium]|jgi:transposase|nr:IS1634 family transposase [Salinivirgaceae bacterium]